MFSRSWTAPHSKALASAFPTQEPLCLGRPACRASSGSKSSLEGPTFLNQAFSLIGFVTALIPPRGKPRIRAQYISKMLLYWHILYWVSLNISFLNFSLNPLSQGAVYEECAWVCFCTENRSPPWGFTWLKLISPLIQTCFTSVLQLNLILPQATCSYAEKWVKSFLSDYYPLSLPPAV